MNKLLVRVYLYLLIMVAFSLVHIGSIQSQILTEGEFWGYEVIAKEDLHIFYQSLNEILRTRFITESTESNKILESNIETIGESYGLGTTVNLLSVYSEDGQWADGSDTTFEIKQDTQYNASRLKQYLRMLTPPQNIDEIMYISGETTDGVLVTFVTRLDQRSLNIMNHYAHSSYYLNNWSIVIAMLIAFLPIGIFFYFNYIRPLNKLGLAANAIARGELDFVINPRGLDEIKDFSKAFDNMRHELEESRSREKAILDNRQQLITNISHDLRTPITSISGYVEGLLDGKGENPERMERYLKTIKSKTEYLNGMINDLFLFSQLDMDGYTLDLRLLNSRDLLEQITEPIELWLDDSPLSLKIDKPFPAVPIKADGARLSQVIENIVQNSIKYSNEDALLIINTSIKDHHLVLSFVDNGIGIKEEALPYVFDAFYREDQSRTQSLGGAGLGLSICKKIIELHKGHLNISSKFGVGTTVDIYLPLEEYISI